MCDGGRRAALAGIQTSSLKSHEDDLQIFTASCTHTSVTSFKVPATETLEVQVDKGPKHARVPSETQHVIQKRVRHVERAKVT